MYYKILNKECQVYQDLYALRQEELRIQDENEKAIEEKTGLNFDTFLGHRGQDNWRRVRQYIGFKFTTPELVDLKIWKPDNKHKEIFVPNRQTKLGREMADFLLHGLKSSRYDRVWKILNLDHILKFRFPYLQVVDDVILISLDEKQEPTDENVIEITKREFYQLQKTSTHELELPLSIRS